jgi:4a-hydroxytetrahydrobiopterin dehydratase
MPAVTFYTRTNCPLCDKARAAIAASGASVTLSEVDVDSDPALHDRYTNDVPVVVIDGYEAFRHKVDPAAFAEVITVIQRGWRIVDGHHLETERTFPDFAAALAFTNRVGAIAEELDHHPEIHLSWGKVGITTWSHDAGGLTRRDFRLAARVDSQ